MSLTAGMHAQRWVIRPVDDRCEQLAGQLGISPILAQVLINRGITDRQQGDVFLKPKLNDLIEPAQMPGMAPAIERLKRAVKNKEKITVYGDYDVDGITGVAILWQALRLLGADVDYYIPHRIDEGYGLNSEAIGALAQAGCRLLITVDCGITAYESAQLAQQLGVDLIITDHHQQGQSMPISTAIVHPALDESYPNQDSAGAMVAFKLAWAIAGEFTCGPKLQPDLREFMLNATSLAAMGTIADIVDLRGENRVLTSYGLKSLPDCRVSGIQALIETAGLTGRQLDSFHIGFRLAPMLNAAGRMGHARLAVELLTSDSHNRAMQIAEYLKSQNDERQRCERKIYRQACEMIIKRSLNHPDRKSIVLAGRSWHIGVIGIVASRLVDKFHRPTIMLALPDDEVSQQKETPVGNNIAQGSARSIQGFCILSAIKSCSEHLVDFGGHKMAAGMTIEIDKIETFADQFENYAQQNLSQDDVVEKLHIDALIPLAKLRREFVNELAMLGPFGQGNPEPVFATKAISLANPPRRVGAQGDHLQLVITDNTASIRCIGFGMGRLEKKLLERDFFNAAYQPKINSFNGNTKVELVLADVQFE